MEVNGNCTEIQLPLPCIKMKIYMKIELQICIWKVLNIKKYTQSLIYQLTEFFIHSVLVFFQEKFDGKWMLFFNDILY